MIEGDDVPGAVPAVGGILVLADGGNLNDLEQMHLSKVTNQSNLIWFIIGHS